MRADVHCEHYGYEYTQEEKKIKKREITFQDVSFVV